VNGPTEDREDPISYAWRLLGVVLSVVALLAVSLPSLLNGEDPLVASAKAAIAFLAVWGLNRGLAAAFDLDCPPEECSEECSEEPSEEGVQEGE
jgi:anti-sigma-K factor RskA